MNLSDLIIQEGKNPLALIDNWDKKYGFACFNFSKTILWNHKGIFVNNKKTDFNTIQDLQKIIDSWKNDSEEIAAIGFLNYHFKDILYPNIKFDKKSKSPYLFFAKPRNLYKYKVEKESYNNSKIKLLQDILDVNNYVDIIKKIKHELKCGNVYQINYTMKKKYHVNCEPFDLYMKMRSFTEPSYGYYFDLNDMHILSFSPEQFFKTKGSKIFSYPMKGTSKRSINKKEDIKYKLALKASMKDQAEHLMIVDLIRNDIGKIANYGTVKTKNLFNIKSYKTVHQMVTEVSGDLKNNIKEFDVIQALFPGGSITGAPKESAMKIIDKIENYNRNLYTGAIGYIKNNGDMNFNIPIRTMSIKDNIGSYSVGGGIVWDSVATDEWNEAQLKSKILHLDNNE
jgi:anthranilate/para-aminobenzoate synthase component I